MSSVCCNHHAIDPVNNQVMAFDHSLQQSIESCRSSPPPRSAA